MPVDFQFDWDKVSRQVEASLGKGITAAGYFAKARVMELVSVPAPRKRVVVKRGRFAGAMTYRAAAKATPGAPPRKLSGLLRSKYEVGPNSDGTGIILSNSAVYAGNLERQGHPHISLILELFSAELFEIIVSGSGGSS